MLESIDLQIAYGAVKHFGRNLYTSNPPALAELIANSWDAYATFCDVINQTSNTEDAEQVEGNAIDGNRVDSLLIIDDGIGMTDNELENKYAKSGIEKTTDDVRKPDNMDLRPYMGKKGIGKFAAFSLSDKYTLYTKSDSDTSWKSIEMNYQDLLVDSPIIKRNVSYHSPDEINTIIEKYGYGSAAPETGTIIIMEALRRKFIKSTLYNLKSLLSRRFSPTTITSHDFCVKLNSDELDLKAHYYYENVEFLMYFGYSEEEISSQFSIADKHNAILINDDDFLLENGVKGWIGTVHKPKDLHLEDEQAIAGVTVYINGKLAEENILKQNQNAMIANSYFVGEVDADFLQNNPTSDLDPVVSSREGLNYEIDDVEKLQKSVNNIRSKLMQRWHELRAKRDEKEQEYLQEILHIPEYQNHYNHLKENERIEFKQYAQRLFDDRDDIDSLIDMYVPVVFSLVNTDTLREIDLYDKDNPAERMAKFAELFDKVGINTAIRLKANLENRLSVIEKLKKAIDDEELEKVFEDHLAENPWLMNPFWDKTRVQIDQQRIYKYIGLDNNEESGRFDLLVKIAESMYPVIVELKREKVTSYSAPNVSEIRDQIYRYRKGLLEYYKDTSEDVKSIDAVYICGVKSFSKLDNTDKKTLKEDKIEILTYNEIIENAEKMYFDAIDVISKRE